MTQIDLNLLQKFARESAETLADMKATGTGHALDDVRIFFLNLKSIAKGNLSGQLCCNRKNILTHWLC